MRSLGGAGEKETEEEVLLLEHDVPHQAFSQAVLSFLPKMPWCITPEVTAKLDQQAGCVYSSKIIVFRAHLY